MKRSLILMLASVFVLSLTPPAFATGNGAPSGPHFNLNIIGVPKGKTEPMINAARHTIFVALGDNNYSVKSNIYLMPGNSFAVCDGNAFDKAYDCNGNEIFSQGASFQLPCNTYLPDCGSSNNNPCLVPCSETYPSASYTVWARQLGQPNHQAIISTCATDTSTGEVVCSTESTLAVVYRYKGKQDFVNVTNQLTSLVWLNSATGKSTRQSLFSSPFADWFWQYDNFGCKLTQIRLYLNLK